MNKVLKEIGFDPKDERFKFLMEVDEIADFNYFRMRAIEQLRLRETDPIQDRENVILACRLLIFYLNAC